MTHEEKQPMKCALHEEWIKEMRQDVKDIKHILTGNGNPEKGVVHRLATVENVSRNATKLMWVVVIGALSGFMSLFWKIAEAYHKMTP